MEMSIAYANMDAILVNWTRCPYPPQLFLLKSLKVLWYIKATSTTDFISLRSGISMNQLTVMAL